MKIRPLVPLALAIAATAVPFAGSTPLRNNRHLQDGDSGVGDFIEPLVNAEDEVDEARKGNTPQVIVGNAEGNMAKKGGSLEELKLVGLVVPVGRRIEIFSTGKYTLEAICKYTNGGNPGQRVDAVVRLSIKYPLEDKDLEDLPNNELYVSQIAEEVNYMPRITFLDENSDEPKHSIPLVSAEYSANPLVKEKGYQLFEEPGDDLSPTGGLTAYGYWGDNPGTSRFDQSVTYPFEVARPSELIMEGIMQGTAGVLAGTGAFGRIQTSEGFHVEFTTANGNGVIARVDPDSCFFSGDVTYTKMKK